MNANLTMVLFMHRSDNNANPFYVSELGNFALYAIAGLEFWGNVIQSMYLLVSSMCSVGTY